MINNKTVQNPMTSGGSRIGPLHVIAAVVVIVIAATVVYKLTSAPKSANVVLTGASPITAQNTAYPPGSPEDMRQLIEAVSRHIVVSSQEVPSVATIADASVLRSKNSVFYKDAADGDRLLIYTDKAILYSPSRDILLNVLPVFAAPTTAQTASTPPVAGNEVALIEVRNGSGLNGMGKTVATNLRAEGLTVLPPVDAQVKTRYAETLIFVTSGKALPNTIATLQEATGGKVVTTLEGEGGLNGDVVVIIGANIKR